VFKKNWKRKANSANEEEQPREIKDVAKARERTMNRAVTLLAAKPRSIAELKERLLEKNWTNPEIVEAVLQKLEEYGYLNDAQFARDFAASKLRQKAVGKRKLQQTLSQKKLEKEVVQSALEKVYEETPESELIERAIKKRLNLRGIPKDRDETKKFFDYLLRQGFGFDVVREKMREITKDQIDEERD
jgi:regulatory protein